MGSTQMSTMDRSFDGRKLRVLIVDDSAAVRQALSDIIAAEPDLEVMATAADPYVAAEKIRRQVPDVILLDIEMPRMDGLTFTRKIMAQRPIPIVICSSLTEAGSDTTIKALEAGAVDVVSKPRVNTAEFLQESRMRICDVLRAAAHARVSPRQRRIAAIRVEEKLTADVILPPVRPERATAHRRTLSSASEHRPAAPKRCGMSSWSCRPKPPALLLSSTCLRNLPRPLPGGSTACAQCRSRKPRMAISFRRATS